MEKFWCELNECVKELQKSGKVVMLGDMNEKVGSEERENSTQMGSGWAE